MRAFRTDAYRTEWQCQIIRNNYQTLDTPTWLFEQAANRFAAKVHVGLRFCQLDLLILNNGLPDQRPTLFPFDLRLFFASKQVHEHKAEIVPRPLIILSGIAETDDKPVV